MPRREELQDEQWALIEPLLPPSPRRADGRGRPGGTERDFVDLTLRRTLERSAGAISVVPDLPPALPTLGR